MLQKWHFSFVFLQIYYFMLISTLLVHLEIFLVSLHPEILNQKV